MGNIWKAAALGAALGAVAAAGAAAPEGGHGHDELTFTLGDILVDSPWARATVPGATEAPVYLHVDNDGEAADRLLAVTSPSAERVEIRGTFLVAGAPQVEIIDGIDVPARSLLEFEPDGLFLALVGLAEPLVEGGDLELVLEFERAGVLEIEVEVLAVDAPDPEPHTHAH